MGHIAKSSKAARSLPASRPKAAASRPGHKNPPETDFLIERLPFVRNQGHGKGRHFWTVARTGDYGMDCRLGADLARETLTVMRESGRYHLLNSIIHDMIAGQTFDGIEVGFINEVAMVAAAK